MSLEQLASTLEERNIPFERDVPLSSYTTFRIGGPCGILARPQSTVQVQEAVLAAEETETSYFFLGNGSNLLVSDKGYSGLVILTSGLSEIGLTPEGALFCGAGVSLSKLCAFARDNALSGLEFAWGIPGSVGGAVYMNAGAYGGEIKNALSRCTFLDEDGTVRSLPSSALSFGYRRSLFTGSRRAVLQAVFALQSEDSAAIRGRMEDYMNRRISKQPLEYPSAGSVFKRPEGAFAGALIEQCGLKGKRIGGAQVSEKHAGFIINRSDASCEDVLNLIRLIQNTVKRETGYQLECEVKNIGD